MNISETDHAIGEHLMSLGQDVSDQIHWVKTSGIQAASGIDSGGVYAWIDEENDQESFLYSEITGYYMTLAYHLAQIDDLHYWRNRAIAAGNWITRFAMQENGAVLTRKYRPTDAMINDPYSFDNGLVSFFDSAMVGYGLVNLYKLTGNTLWLESASLIADFCLERFSSSDKERFYPIYDLKTSECYREDTHWSSHWGAFELKCALFFVSLLEQSTNPQYTEFIDFLVSDTLKKQQPDGRFITNVTLNSTHLHPHNYTTEALLFLAAKYQRSDLFEHAKSAIDFSFTYCLDPAREITHSWPVADSYCSASFRSDALAQSLRCYFIAKLLEPRCSWDWEERVPTLIEILNKFTLPGGGTSYGVKDDGDLLPHANSWCHFFNVQMRLYKACFEQAVPIKPENIIIV